MSFGLASLRRWLGAGRADAAAGASGDRWIVVDTETSGLDPERDALLAIGAVAIDGEGIRIEDSFEIVLKSDPAPDAANVVIHGIGRDAQAAGVPAAAALGAFLAWAAGAPRVGFHSDFDRAVLRNACAGAKLAVRDAPWLDLAPLALALDPDPRHRNARSFDDWLAAFRIDCTFRHNAASDALAAAELLLRLRAVAALQGAQGFDALLRTARAQKWLGRPG